MLNSKNFGVAQNRERIYIVASLGNGSAREIFPFGAENSGTIEVVGRIESDTGGTGKVYNPGGLAPTQLAQHGNAVTKIAINTTNHKMGKPTDIANALLARNYKGLANQQEMTVVMEPSGIYTGVSSEFLRQPLHGMSRYLKGNKHDAGIIDTNYRIRKLTPLECMRLQSYPDWWYVTLKLFRHPEYIEQVDMSRNDITAQVLDLIQRHGLKEGMSDSQLYKMAGNGVTSEVARQIGIRITRKESEAPK